jgi:hypothetical protein
MPHMSSSIGTSGQPGKAGTGMLVDMVVEVANGTGQRLVRGRSAVVVQVRSTQVVESIRGLELARTGIGGLEAGSDEVSHLRPGELAGPKQVSEVISTPDGPMLYLDLGEDLPAARIRGIPDLIVRSLQRAGVTEAVVCCPRRGGPLSQLYAGPHDDKPYPRGTGMLLWAPPTRTTQRSVPGSWVDAAMSWLAGLGSIDAVGVDVLGVEFRVDLGGARHLLRQVLDGRSSVMMVAGNLNGRVRTVHASTICTSRLTLAERGPEVTDDDRIHNAEHLAALGRRICADVEYAAVDLDVGWDFTAWYQCGMSSGMFEHRGTELVEGVYWWQLLGEGHRARMADTSSLTPLPVQGRYEVLHGRVEQWLPAQRSRVQRQQECQELLRDCFD